MTENLLSTLVIYGSFSVIWGLFLYYYHLRVQNRFQDLLHGNSDINPIGPKITDIQDAGNNQVKVTITKPDGSKFYQFVSKYPIVR